MSTNSSYLQSHARKLKYLIEDMRAGYERLGRIKSVYDYNSLKKVRISCDGKFEHFIRLQTPGGFGVWKETVFLSSTKRDIDLVINKRNPFVKLNKDVERNWLLHIEPPGYIEKLGLGSEKEMDKFGKVFTCNPRLFEMGGKYIASPPYVHWHLAINSYTNEKEATIYDYDFLLNCNSEEIIAVKENVMSTINSNINNLPGHKLRADFISSICERGMNFNLFGHSYWSKYKQYKNQAPSGKWPAFLTSKYVLVIENEISPYYWTEKFTDAILCFCIPIYYGSAKIDEYFPEGSYIALDITKPTAYDEIQDIVKSDFYERNIENLKLARNLILTTHNLFSFIDRQVQEPYL